MMVGNVGLLRSDLDLLIAALDNYEAEDATTAIDIHELIDYFERLADDFDRNN